MRNCTQKCWSTSEQTLKYFDVVLFVLSHSCPWPNQISLHVHSVCTLPHQSAARHLRIGQSKDIYYVGALLFVLSPSSYRNSYVSRPKPIRGKILLIPTFSHHLPSVPSPSIQTLLGCRQCRQSGSTEINIQLRYEWGFPNNDWHTDIERETGESGRHGQTEQQEVECKMSKDKV